jgi:DNA-binding CsgD family transcriptional regulator
MRDILEWSNEGNDKEHIIGSAMAFPEGYRDVLEQLRLGVTDQTASRQLNISPRTFSRRVADLLDYLGVKTRFQAGVEAARRGWVTFGSDGCRTDDAGISPAGDGRERWQREGGPAPGRRRRHSDDGRDAGGEHDRDLQEVRQVQPWPHLSAARHRGRTGGAGRP